MGVTTPRADILADLTACYGKRRGYVCIAWKDRNNPNPDHYDQRFFAWPTERSAAASFVKNLVETGCCVWRPTSLCAGQSRTDTVPSNVLSFEVDELRDRDAAKALLVEVGASVVSSGSKGHFHVYVTLDQDLEHDELRRLGRHLYSALGVVDGGKCEPNGVLRIIGTWNTKHDPPIQVTRTHRGKGTTVEALRSVLASYPAPHDMSRDRSEIDAQPIDWASLSKPARTAVRKAYRCIPDGDVSARAFGFWKECAKQGIPIEQARGHDPEGFIEGRWPEGSIDQQVHNAYEQAAPPGSETQTPPRGSGEGDKETGGMTSSHDDTTGRPAFAIQDIDPGTLTKTAKGQLRYAYRVAERYQGLLCHGQGNWYQWDGRRWALGDGSKPASAAIRDLISEGVKNGDEESEKMCSGSAIKAVTGMLEGILAVDADTFDQQVHLMNLHNGVYDFNQQKLLPHNASLRLSKMAHGAYTPGKQSKVWDDFVSTVMPDEDLRRYVQKLFGLVLTGEHRQEVFPIFLGPGGTGKSRLVGALNDALGNDYSHSLASTVLKVTKFERHTTEVYALKGKRLGFSMELDQRARYADGMVKKLTGGDPVNGRGMRQDDGYFDPTHTLILYTNSAPILPPHDDGLIRRVRIIRFDRVIREPIDNMKAMLKAEADAVITWAIEGWSQYVAEGLKPPRAVIDATDDYWASMNPVAQWKADRCVDDPQRSDEMGTRALYTNFEDWILSGGGNWDQGERGFGAVLDRMGHTTRSGGGKTRRGINLKSAEESE